MMNIDEIYVINLDRDVDRLKQMDKQLDNYTRFPAIYGKDLDLQELTDKKEVVFVSYSFFNSDKGGRNSLHTSIGCALTHKKLWESFLLTDNEIILALEDDVIIPSDWKTLALERSKKVPDDWDVIFLGGSRIYGKLASENIIEAHTPHWWRNCGLFAYILNRKGAKKFLGHTTPLITYIDAQLNCRYGKELKAYYITPSIIKHDWSVPSSRLAPTFRYTKGFQAHAETVGLIG